MPAIAATAIPVGLAAAAAPLCALAPVVGIPIPTTDLHVPETMEMRDWSSETLHISAQETAREAREHAHEAMAFAPPVVQGARLVVRGALQLM